jgi:HPt (histidine-containing phosphotransfer) domain-containing protein
MPGWLRELEHAAEQGDLVKLRRQAHKLLGLCRQIGAERMAEVLSTLEWADNIFEDDRAVGEVARLQTEFSAAYRVLDNRHLLD